MLNKWNTLVRTFPEKTILLNYDKSRYMIISSQKEDLRCISNLNLSG